MGSTSGTSDVCYFCEQRVYLVERHSAEGVFFHRGCLKCEYCGTNLRIGQYCFRREDDGTGSNTVFIVAIFVKMLKENRTSGYD